MPGMKQRVIDVGFGRELSDEGETDGRKKSMVLCHLYFSFQLVFLFRMFP